jgi:hypothetical protein
LTLLALAALAALTVRILLLLARLLAAALLLAGLLTRVLILLARILVWVGHFGNLPFALLGMQQKGNAQRPELVSEKIGSRTIIAWRGSVTSVALEPAEKTTVYSRLSRIPYCCRPRFPLLENDLRRGVPAAGAIAALRQTRAFRKVGTGCDQNSRNNNGSAWIISPSN